MKRKCDELLEVEYIYRNRSSKWACAPLIVPKEGSEKFRFIVDLRPVNAQTKKNVWPMPHADPMLAELTGAKASSSWTSSMGIGSSLSLRTPRSASHSTRRWISLQTAFFTVPRIPFRTSSPP